MHLNLSRLQKEFCVSGQVAANAIVARDTEVLRGYSILAL